MNSSTNELTSRYTQTISAQELNLDKLNEAFMGVSSLEDAALLRMYAVPYDLWKGVYLGTSGGKDSVTCAYLMTKCDRFKEHNSLPAVHTSKPGITHPKTLEFLYSIPYHIRYCPKGTAMPMAHLTQIDGTRASEFDRADGRSTDIVVGGRTVSRENMPCYLRNGLFGLNFIFPIFDWTDEQVWAYIFKNNIPYSDEYLESKHTNVVAPGAR